jgi:integrase/recombinase XerD
MAAWVPLLYEVADDRDLPQAARDADGRMAWRLQARHRLHQPETPVDRASDEQVVALVRACRSARDRLIVLLMARAGLRRGELRGCGAATCTWSWTRARWAAGSPVRTCT